MHYETGDDPQPEEEVFGEKRTVEDEDSGGHSPTRDILRHRMEERAGSLKHQTLMAEEKYKPSRVFSQFGKPQFFKRRIVKQVTVWWNTKRGL